MSERKISYFPSGRGGLQPVAPAPRPERGISELIHDLAPMQDATDIADLCAGLAYSITGALHADACLVSLLDDDGRTVRDVAASVVAPVQLPAVAEAYPLDKFPITRRVLESGVSFEISVSDPEAEESEKAILNDLGFARVLICQLAVEGKAIGIVETYRIADRPFRQDDPRQVAVLSAFAGNAYTRIQLAAKLESHYLVTLEALVSALEARDPYTHQHAGRIRDMSVALSVAMHLGGDDRRAVRLGSVLHDVGKIGISDGILLKPGPLTEDEWDVMRSHPQIGERMLKGIDFLEPALPVIRHHHERWDGRGYPDGLAGDDIPIGARIVAVCDSFDAITSDRPYRQSRSVEFACEEILKMAGTQFDPTCANLLVETITNVGPDRLEERFVRYAS